MTTPMPSHCYVGSHDAYFRSLHFKMWPMTDTTNNNNLSNSPDSSDSDDDVLQAVLEFVESFDGHEHQNAPAKTTAPDRASSTRKRHSSERIRSEIEALRDLAMQLEDRLAHLKFEQIARANASRVAGNSGWAIEALRQEEQRLQSEMENLQLKAVVEAQAKVTQRLEVLFERRVRHQGEDDATSERQSLTAHLGN